MALAASPPLSISDKLSRHDEVLKAYREKFEDHKKWLQGQREMPSFIAKEGGELWDEETGSVDNMTSPAGSPRRGEARGSRQHIHDQLLEKGKLYNEHKEALRERAIRQELSQLRSVPKISKQGKSKVYEKPIQERFMELEERKQKDLLEARSGRQEEPPKYSFRPDITAKGKQAAPRVNRSGAMEQWKMKREQKMTEKATLECKPQPDINPHSRKIVERRRKSDPPGGGGPHYTHADSLLERDRLSKLHLWEKYQQELLEQQPGNPKITPFAASLHRDGPVCDRLYENSFDREERKNHLLRKKMAKEEVECYHTPRITPNAAALRRSIPVEDDLLDRYDQALSRKEEGIRQALERERYLHQPVINPVSDEIASRLSQTARERLYGHKLDYSVLQEQYPFRPQLSPKPQQKSVQRSRTRDFHRRGERDKEMSMRKINTLREQQEMKEMAHCTFKPKICRPPVEMNANMDVLSRAEQWQKKKEQRLQAERRQRDLQESAACPFTPNLEKHHSHPAPGSETESLYGGDGRAWGFGEFVERHREARRRQTEKAEGAWVTGKNWRNEVTVPQEFNLGRRDKPVKSLNKPISPPRNHAEYGAGYPEDEEYDENYFASSDAQLPQRGLFSAIINPQQAAHMDPGPYPDAADHYEYPPPPIEEWQRPQQMEWERRRSEKQTFEGQM